MKRDRGYALLVVVFLAVWFFALSLVDFLDRRIPNTPPKIVKVHV